MANFLILHLIFGIRILSSNTASNCLNLASKLTTALGFKIFTYILL
jgi:hypothetical protein